MTLNPAGTRIIRLVLVLSMAMACVGLTSLLSGNAAEEGSQPQAAAGADKGADVEALKALIAKYAQSIDAVDTNLAAEVWLDSPDVSFIHPLGHEHGFEQVKANVYKRLMGGMFSERKLSPRDISVHVHGDSAWAEFYWDFAAKLRTDGSAVTTHGRETQVYWKVDGRWRLVHVHYSGMPFSQNRTGF